MNAADIQNKAKFVTDADGKTVEVILPYEIFHELLDHQISQELSMKGTETLFVSHNEAYSAQFRREAAAFLAMHAQLLREYEGKFVAVYQEAVVDVDEDDRKLFRRTLNKYGDNTPFYIQKVVKEGIPIVSIPGIDID
jgi:hypothetical protein